MSTCPILNLPGLAFPWGDLMGTCPNLDLPVLASPRGDLMGTCSNLGESGTHRYTALPGRAHPQSATHRKCGPRGDILPFHYTPCGPPPHLHWENPGHTATLR